MPTKRRRIGRHRIEMELSPYVLGFLRTGVIPERGDEPGWFDCFQRTHDDGAGLRDDWEAVRDAVLAAWIAESPGTRPWAWWRFDSPAATEIPERIRDTCWARQYRDPRRRLGGIGTPAYEALNIAPCFAFGLPTSWVTADDVALYNGQALDVRGVRIDMGCEPGDFPFDAIDPTDPPRFESEAAYLERHGLLTSAERRRLPATTFDPERIEIEQEGADDAA